MFIRALVVCTCLCGVWFVILLCCVLCVVLCCVVFVCMRGVRLGGFVRSISQRFVKRCGDRCVLTD